MTNDPFAQRPVTRPGNNGMRPRPPIHPVSEAMQRSRPLREEQAKETRMNQLQLVAVDRIQGSRFQHRDELNTVEDKEYQQLFAQVSSDLELLSQGEVRTIEHVFIVMPDDENEEKLILAKGGHRRFQVCLDLGIEVVYVWIKPYNEESLATGTYMENKGRKKTSWLEDARTFKDIMETLEWTQSELAHTLHVEGGQSHVSRCLAMLNYHPDLQRMLALSEERGMRASKELARLEKHFGTGKARELWTPLIAAFLNEELYTDDIEKKVNQLVGETSATAKKLEVTEIPMLRKQRLAQGIHRKWQSFRAEIGHDPLDELARAEVEAVYREMGEFLGHI